MSQERIEAAKRPLADDGEWTGTDEQMQRVLAATDAVTFSDEAIERAARVLDPDLFRSNHTQSLFARKQALDKIRAVVAALKGDA